MSITPSLLKLTSLRHRFYADPRSSGLAGCYRRELGGGGAASLPADRPAPSARARPGWVPASREAFELIKGETASSPRPLPVDEPLSTTAGPSGAASTEIDVATPGRAAPDTAAKREPPSVATAEELIERCRASRDDATSLPAPLATLLSAILRAHAAGALGPARELTEELQGPLASDLDAGLVHEPQLQLLWTAAQELSALPADFPVAVRRIFALSLLTENLSSSRHRLRQFTLRHRREAEVAASQIAHLAPMLHRDFAAVLNPPRRKRSVAFRVARIVLFTLPLLAYRMCHLSAPAPTRAGIRAYQEQLADRAAHQVHTAEARSVLEEHCVGASSRTPTCTLGALIVNDLEAGACQSARDHLEMMQFAWEARLRVHAARQTLEPFGSVAAAVQTECGTAPTLKRRR